MSDKEPELITRNGHLNVRPWTEWYMAKHGVPFLRAHKVYNELVQGMPEPNLTVGEDKPNPRWVAWYRLQKKVSSNSALGTCRMRIQALKEGKVVKELKAWW
jgi:hypothetical protein